MQNAEWIGKLRIALIGAVFCLVIGGFALMGILTPDAEYSKEERRPLAQVPTYSPEEGTAAYFADWDRYLTDQFYLRDKLRFLKSGFAHTVLLQTDVNGYYSKDGSHAELLYPTDLEMIGQNVRLMESLRAELFADASAFWAVIPDKSYAMDLPLGLDYGRIDGLFADTLQATPIPLRDTLAQEDYFATDIHWRQENLRSVYEALRPSLRGDLPAWEEAGFVPRKAGEFYGVLYGQAALPARPDELYYLENASTAALKLTVVDTGKVGALYDLSAFAGDDPYDLFLGGEAAILQIQNPNCTNGRRLILFRDSFGRSLAPLLAPGYEEVILVDLRWIRSAYLDRFADLLAVDANTDLLFLYSAQVLNSMQLG